MEQPKSTSPHIFFLLYNHDIGQHKTDVTTLAPLGLENPWPDKT